MTGEREAEFIDRNWSDCAEGEGKYLGLTDAVPASERENKVINAPGTDWKFRSNSWNNGRKKMKKGKDSQIWNTETGKLQNQKRNTKIIKQILKYFNEK